MYPLPLLLTSLWLQTVMPLRKQKQRKRVWMTIQRSTTTILSMCAWSASKEHYIWAAPKESCNKSWWHGACWLRRNLRLSVSQKKGVSVKPDYLPRASKTLLKTHSDGEEHGCFSKAADCGGFFMTCKSLKRWRVAPTSTRVGAVKLLSTKGHISIVAFDCKTAFKLLTCAQAHSSIHPFWNNPSMKGTQVCQPSSLRNIMESSWCNNFCSYCISFFSIHTIQNYFCICVNSTTHSSI